MLVTFCIVLISTGFIIEPFIRSAPILWKVLSILFRYELFLIGTNSELYCRTYALRLQNHLFCSWCLFSEL